MKIHIFECNDDSQTECFEKKLFGSNVPWPLTSVRAGDYCLLYNYTKGKDHFIFGIWKAETNAAKNIDKNAWWGLYPYQVRVRLCSKEYQCIPRRNLDKIVTNNEGRVMNTVMGSRAQDLLQYFANAETVKIIFGQEMAKYEEDFRDKYPADFRCDDGHKVRSLSEKTIDDWFSRNDVRHDYERLINIPEHLIPDFTLYDEASRPVYIEFWGMPDYPFYRERMQRKIETYMKYRFPLIEIRQEDLRSLDFFMHRELNRKGIRYSRSSP